MIEFFDMGGYGVFIWPGYTIVFVVLIALAVRSHRRLVNLEKAVRDLKSEDDEGFEKHQIIEK